MRIVRAEDVEWMTGPASHRRGTLHFKRLAWGVDNTPENYLLVLAKTDGDYYAPRHRHNFDQIRFSIEGRSSMGPKTYLNAGEIAYFPEGAHYGPQEDTGEYRMGVTLQFGGASGQGYLSWEQMEVGRQRLLKEGTFKDGIFHRTSGEGKINQDAFEAIWESVNGRKLEYPKARYRSHITCEPASFDWQATRTLGVETKTLGVFTERGVRMEQFRLAQGARLTIAAEPAIRLIFIMDGAGTCAGQAIGRHTLADIGAHESAELRADTTTEIFVMVLPLLAQSSVAKAA
jgi:hypothetical protein